MQQEYIYVFPADLFDRDEAHKWVYDPHYAKKLDELVNDGRIEVYTIRQFTKACNNREIFDMWSHWLVRKICQTPDTPKIEYISRIGQYEEENT